MLLFYLLCCLCLCVPSFENILIFLVSCPILIFTLKSLLFTPISCVTWDSAWWGGREGGPCMDRSRMRTRTWCYPGVQFNLIAWYLILGPRPAPVTARNWRAELRGSSVSRTSKQLLQCVYLPTPVREKWVLPFFFCHDLTQLIEHN